MSVYAQVQAAIEDLKVGQLTTIPLPNKLGAFRKFLTEISRKDHKKFTTRVEGSNMHIMRVKYFSVSEKLSEND